MDELQISGRRFISSRRIARDNGYTADYIGQLIRGGKVVGQKVGRAWYVDAASFESYLGQELASTQLPEEKVMPPPISVERKPVEKIPDQTVVEEKKPALPTEAIRSGGEETHHVPLHIVKTETSAGLHYYQDDSLGLPAIREIRTEKSEPWVAYPTEETETESVSDAAFVPQATRAWRGSRIAGLAMLGIAIFVLSAAVSSLVSLDLSIETGNAASVSYGFHW